MSLRARIAIGIVAGVLWAASAAPADTVTIDFEDYAVGTIITNQYDGVTFSAPPDSCGGSPPVRPIIVTPNGGTSSPTRGLSVQTGCPDFSPDFLRMIFDQPQGEVTFTVGDSPGTHQVRAYNVPVGEAAGQLRDRYAGVCQHALNVQRRGGALDGRVCCPVVVLPRVPVGSLVHAAVGHHQDDSAAVLSGVFVQRSNARRRRSPCDRENVYGFH